ncbi:MAG: hypothetical protein NW200_05315 [Hyphomonadaceae bacterium]|nr:hypothetical protein [Hyphomonadaceae bacterium]
MTHAAPFLGRSHQTGCTIEIEHSETSLHAHVTLDDATKLGPGDRVRVHGAPIRLQFGEKMLLRRVATVEQAGWFARVWTKLAARFELSELYEVSFTPRRLP